MNYTGIRDSRTKQEKFKDWHSLELAGTTPFSFEEREPLSYTTRSQDGSNSCVAQTVAKMVEVWDFKFDKEDTVYSATPIYQSRSNKPQGGMNAVEAFNSAIKNTYLESEVPSQQMSDSQMDSETSDGTPQKVKPTNYLSHPIDFYKAASEINNVGAVMLWFKCAYEEWNKDVPTGLSNSEVVRHSVCGVDTIKWKDKEYIVIEDSWGKWEKNTDVPLKDGQRAITKEFFDKHCYFVGSFTEFTYGQTTKPKHTFIKYLKFGDIDPEVKWLQKILQYEEFFPSNQTPTDYFGSITANAFKKWLLKHGVTDYGNEIDIRRIRFYTKSLKLANSLYG